MQTLSASLAVWAAVLALAGCMNVRIESPGQPVRVVRHVGVLRVEVPAAQQAVVGSLTGVGIAGTPLGWTGGYARLRWAALGTECRAVVFLEPGAQLDLQARRALAEVAGACLLADETVTPLAKEPSP